MRYADRPLVRSLRVFLVALIAVVLEAIQPPSSSGADCSSVLLTGPAAYGDWRNDAPGVRRAITPADLPPPFQSRSAFNSPHVIPRPDGAFPRVPDGFVVSEFAHGLSGPRLVRVAPNGDIFVAESRVGRITILRAADGDAKATTSAVFAEGLTLPFGLAFWPSGPNPQYVYVGNTDSVVRFPYRNGDLKARGPVQVVVANLPTAAVYREAGHWTRDVVFSADGSRMFVAVGSLSNDAEGLLHGRLSELLDYATLHALGALFGSEEQRADILAFDPAGKTGGIYATGIRNCVGMALNPVTNDLWCSTNERDGLGDNLPPDYITSVHRGGFYGWPWYYIGNNEDPRHRGERPDLKNKVTIPDVLLQPHSGSLAMTFYTGSQFPAEYRNDIFACEHGSWNRSARTGYKLIRVLMRNGKPTGEYEDFMTGFVQSADAVWGRPVGIAVAHDGALIVTEDANGSVWRIAWRGNQP